MSNKRNVVLFKLLRYSILAGVLIFVSWQVFSHALGNKIFPAIHGLCPFGGVESLYLYLSQDGLTLAKIFSGTMAIFFMTVVITIVFGRTFCGNICPLGTLQEGAGNAGRLILKDKFIIPRVIDRPLRYLKYVILIISVFMAWATATLWFQVIDPWAAYGHILKPQELFSGYLIGLIILIISLVMSFFFERFFCKYMCPMGAFNALVGILSRSRVVRDTELCISCGLCSKACPVQIEVDKQDVVKSKECINCSKCVIECPEHGALKTSFWGLKLKPIAFLLLTVGVFFGGIFTLQMLGFDRYSGKAEATLREVAKQQGFTVEDFINKYDLPESVNARTKMSKVQELIPFYKMAEINNTSTESLKELLGLPDELDNNTPWGKAYDEVKLSKIAELQGATIEEYISYYELGDEVNAETRWKEVKGLVEEYNKLNSGSESCGGH